MPEEKLIMLYGIYVIWKKLPCRLQAKFLHLALTTLAEALKDQEAKEKKQRRPVKKRPHHPEDF